MAKERTVGPGPVEAKEEREEAANKAQRSAEITDTEKTLQEAGEKIVKAVDPDKKENTEEDVAA